MKGVTMCLKGLLLFLGLALLASCAPSYTPTQAVPTEAPAAEPSTEVISTPAPTPTAFIEERLVEMEWPSHLRLGESDVLRLSLIPAKEGYVARAEFEEHPLETQEAPIRHAPGYTLQGIARLDGIGFDISPAGEQRRILSPGEPAAWRWTLSAREPGRHRLSVSLTLRWEPEQGVTGPVSESLAYGRGLDVQVDSILGMTQSQAVMASLFGLLFGAGIGGLALVSGRRAPQVITGLRRAAPNRALAIELGPGIRLAAEEVRIAQALFSHYQRVLIDGEFKSGYSGARALLVRPVSANGMADAETIAKLGPRMAIQAEFENYERFVKDRLPPVTARIQQPPVTVAGGKLAGLQYTFIAEPGHTPRSLRQALLDKPDPIYLQRLFQTFGPNWWMQRQAYTFRLEAEYDRLLPPQAALEPVSSGRVQATLEPGSTLPLKSGDILRLGRFHRLEPRPDGKSWSLLGEAAAGRPALRVRWLSAKPPASGELARVVASRVDLLRGWTASFERFGLSDPLQHLEGWLATTIQGTRSTIHGDLNLENILVGPGELVWLIDFAQTREGHPMFDFAHLAAEIVAHILAERCGSGEAYLERLAAGEVLLQTVQEIASRCTFDSQQVNEYRLPLILACLGALKFNNLSPLARHCLYLTAAFEAGKI